MQKAKIKVRCQNCYAVNTVPVGQYVFPVRNAASYMATE
jgi:hypothetical protein